MAILGLLLLLAAAGLAVDAVVENTSSITVEAVGATFSMSPGWLYVAGLATGAIALLGVGLLVAGITRARRRRVALADSRTSVQDLQAERDRLAVELQRQRAARTATPQTPRADDQLAGDAAVIDLGDEPRPACVSDDDVAVSGAAGPERAGQRDPVGSGRSGLLHRRH